MIIRKLSSDFTPLHEGIFFGIESEDETPSDIIVEVLELPAGEVIATKLLHEVESATINIAPYVGHFVDYAPTSQRSTSFGTAPMASYKIRVNDIESEEVVVSVNRASIVSTPALIASMPNRRRVARGENDELLIASCKGRRIYAEMVAENGEMLHIDYLPTTDACTLIISPDDFSPAVREFDLTLFCDGALLESVHYTIATPLRNSIRLAWLSASGAIERYTFPRSHKCTVSVERKGLVTEDGPCNAHCRTREVASLCSRLEPHATIEALAQIISAPKVWIERNGEFNLVEVETSSLVYDLFGEPSHIHLDVCLWQKEVAL